MHGLCMFRKWTRQVCGPRSHCDSVHDFWRLVRFHITIFHQPGSLTNSGKLQALRSLMRRTLIVYTTNVKGLTDFKLYQSYWRNCLKQKIWKKPTLYSIDRSVKGEAIYFQCYDRTIKAPSLVRKNDNPTLHPSGNARHVIRLNLSLRSIIY